VESGYGAPLSEVSEARFAGYVESLASVLRHADRRRHIRNAF
jgi:hypothetical protein